MTSLAQAIKVVKDPDLPTRPRGDDNDRDRTRTRTAHLRSATWLRSQCAWYRYRGEECPVDAPLFGLVESALNDLAIACERVRAETAAELIARGGEPYRSIDLGHVAVGCYRTTSLADVLDAEASYYLDLGTEIATLAAWAVLWHAEGVEYHGAQSVAEYLEADESETAFINAMDTVFGGSYASLENPLW